MNSAPLTGAIDAQTFRNIAKAQSPTVVYIQTTARFAARETDRDLSGGDDLLRRFFGGQAARSGADPAPRGRAPEGRSAQAGGREQDSSSTSRA